jgi:hypothetical protein
MTKQPSKQPGKKPSKKKATTPPRPVFRPFVLAPGGACVEDVRERWRVLQMYRHLFIGDDFVSAALVRRASRDIYVESKHNLHSTRYTLVVDSPSEGLLGFPLVYEVHYVFPQVRHLPIWQARMAGQQQNEYWEHLPGGDSQRVQVMADIEHIWDLCYKRAKRLETCQIQYLQRFMPWFTRGVNKLYRASPRLPEICE